MWIRTQNEWVDIHAAAFGMSTSPPWIIGVDTAGNEEYTIGAYKTKEEALRDLHKLRAALREGKSLVDLSEIAYGTEQEQASELEP